MYYTQKSHSKEILRTMATSVPYYVSSQLNILIRVWLTSILCCENTADLWLFTICKDVNLTASTTKCLRQQHKALPLQRWCNHPFPHFQAVISPGVWRTPSPTPLVKKQIKIHQKKGGLKNLPTLLNPSKGVRLYQRMSTIKYEATHVTREGCRCSVYNFCHCGEGKNEISVKHDIKAKQ